MQWYRVTNTSRDGRAIERASYTFPADGQPYEVLVAPWHAAELRAHRNLLVKGPLGARDAAGDEIAPAPGVEPEEPFYGDLTNDQLRSELEDRGLSASGNKADLIARLEEDDTL